MRKLFTIPDTELTFFPFGLGTVSAGIAWDGADADRIFDTFLAEGGSLIDTAHVYSDWIGPERARSERVVGDWLERSGKRNQVILMTKGGHPDMTVPKPDLHCSRLSREEMRRDLEESLRKLRTDYIDLYFYHRDDLSRSVEELMDTMEMFRREGKIRYYGCSNWSLARMQQADDLCREKGYRGFAADQSLFNLGYRYMNAMPDDTLGYTDEAAQKYHRENLRNVLMPYMGVCSGFFHKYARGGVDAVCTSPYCTEGNIRMAERVKMLCKKYDATVSQVVLGFFGQQEFPCVPLYGPKHAGQLTEAMAAFDIPFCREDYEE